jgi:transcriptional regulator with XRE-family HTH domain
MTFGAYLKSLRENAEFSQDFISREIGVSRPTYVQIERGERELTVSEAQKLAELFGLPLEQFLAQGKPAGHLLELQKSSKKVALKPEVRISIPKLHKEKFKAVLLYILEKVGAKPNIGETALYKLLYFIDFDFYEKFEEQLTGATYIRNHFGPSPVEFQKLVKEMQAEGELEPVSSSYFQYEQKKYLPKKNADLTLLNAQELAHIEEVLNRLSDKSAAELSNYSHSDIPWKVHKPGEKIDYESVFYRDQEHSVRNYDDQL